MYKKILKNTQKKYWINVVSKEHTELGVKGGFMQSCHGKKAPLLRINKQDWVLFYSSKEKMNSKEKYQCFTAIGEILDDEVFNYQMSENFCPFRRRVTFYPCKEVSILPLIKELDFIENKKFWGYPFRYGLLEIKEKDFIFLKNKMTGDS